MKNRTLRISLILAILTLVTSCFMGSTFAKYTTGDSALDTARVAKWGVVVDFSVDQTNNELAKLYATDDTAVSGTITNSVNVDTSISDMKLVAPGTEGNIFAAAITGKPEVAVTVENVFTATFTGWEITDGFYCPIQFDVTRKFVGGTVETETFCGLDYDSATDFADAIIAWFTKTANYAPNTDLASEFTVDWEWAFDTSSGNYYAGSEIEQTDARDTELANLATMPSFSLGYTINVTQID